MKQTLKKVLRSPITTGVLFLLAAVMLLGSTVGGTRAALTYYSETYTSRVQMYEIGVSLTENGQRVAWRDYSSEADGSWNEGSTVLLGSMLGEGETVTAGKSYPERLAVYNSGTIDQYVRVILYRYWVDAEGKKVQGLDPSLIELKLTNLDAGWVVDEQSSTAERTVLYYDRPLAAGTSTPELSETLRISGLAALHVKETVTQDGAFKTITTKSDYDGAKFQLEVEVDAVQLHNAADAIHSAWGPTINVSGDRLTLGKGGAQ